MKFRFVFLIVITFFSNLVFSADSYVSGKVTKLMAHPTDPAIMIGANLVPGGCSGGSWGWLKFDGATAQEKQWVYSTALAMALSGKEVTVYTNTDGGPCRIANIQIISGLN